MSRSLPLVLSLLVAGCGEERGRAAPVADARSPDAAVPDESPADRDAAPHPRPVEGIRLVVRVDHQGARPGKVSASDPAVRLLVEHAAAETRVNPTGAGLPIRSRDPWSARSSPAAWIGVAEGASVAERISLVPWRPVITHAGTPAGGPAHVDGIVEGTSERVRLVVRGGSTGGTERARALAPVVALSLAGVDTEGVLRALESPLGSAQSWDVRWPGRPVVSWVVESEEPRTMLLGEAPRGDDLPTAIARPAGAAQTAVDLARRLAKRGEPVVDDRVSLTVRNVTDRTLLVYVGGSLVGWVTSGSSGRFLGVPEGRHRLFATSLRGTVALSATVSVPGEWVARPRGSDSPPPRTGPGRPSTARGS